MFCSATRCKTSSAKRLLNSPGYTPIHHPISTKHFRYVTLHARIQLVERMLCSLMRVQEHVKISATAALIALPWLKTDVWIPFAASILIDVDHYLWHAITHRTLSLRAAVRYFGQADPPRRPEARLLHHPLVLGSLLFLAIRLRSRLLALILAGLLFHVSLDVIHGRQMSHLKQTLNDQAQRVCAPRQRHATISLPSRRGSGKERHPRMPGGAA